jgi:hypothetical protein
MNKLLKTINNVICTVANIYLLDIVLRIFFKKILYTQCYEVVSAIGFERLKKEDRNTLP